MLHLADTGIGMLIAEARKLHSFFNTMINLSVPPSGGQKPPLINIMIRSKITYSAVPPNTM